MKPFCHFAALVEFLFSPQSWAVERYQTHDGTCESYSVCYSYVDEWMHTERKSVSAPQLRRTSPCPALLKVMYGANLVW